MLLGIVFLISTGKGTVRLEFSDPAAARQCTISVDGNDIRVENLGEPIRLQPGKHRLRILRGEVEIETREFDVLLRGVHVVHVEIAASPAKVHSTPASINEPGDFEEADLIQRRAYDLACRGEYARAISEYTKAIGRYPDEVQWWLQRAVAELAEGRHELYREHCAEMLRRFGKKQNLGHHPSADICWACFTAPGGIADAPAALALADRALEAIPDREIYIVRRGAVRYRTGRLEEAIADLSRAHSLLQDKAEPHLLLEDVMACSFLAMAHDQLARRDDAKTWLAKAQKQMERARQEARTRNLSVYWNNDLPPRLIFDEARATLGEKPPDSRRLLRKE